jgi:hypothetical protein
VDQEVEHLRFQVDGLAIPPEFAAGNVEHVVGKAKLHASHPIGKIKRRSRISQG